MIVLRFLMELWDLRDHWHAPFLRTTPRRIGAGQKDNNNNSHQQKSSTSKKQQQPPQKNSRSKRQQQPTPKKQQVKKNFCLNNHHSDADSAVAKTKPDNALKFWQWQELNLSASRAVCALFARLINIYLLQTAHNAWTLARTVWICTMMLYMHVMWTYTNINTNVNRFWWHNLWGYRWT